MVVTANRIIRDPKLELESSRFTFDLVPLSYESVDVVVGENWLLRHKAEMTLSLIRPDVLRREYGVEREMIVESLKEEKMYVKFSNNVEAEQRGSYLDVEGIKWHAWKREKVIACTSRQLKVLMKDCMANVFDFEAKCHLGKANVDIVPWSEAKNEFEIDVRRFDLGGDYHLSMDVLHLKHGMERNVGYRFMGRNWRELWVVEGLTLERCSTFGKKDKLEPSYVGPFEILRWIGPIVRLRISII
ncbi:hypothetical protein Tco_0194266 [Tanacetum coccineum]